MMNLKKTLTHFATTLILIFILAACSKEEKEPDPQPVLPEKLDGAWFLHKAIIVEYDSLNQEISRTDKEGYKRNIEYNLTPPSDYKERYYDNVTTGTYKVSQDSLIITLSETPTSAVLKIYKIESMLPGELTVSQTAPTPSSGRRTFINIWKR